MRSDKMASAPFAQLTSRTVTPMPRAQAIRRRLHADSDPVYMSRKIRKFRTDKFNTRNKRKILYPFFHVSNLSVRNFRIFLLMYTRTALVTRAREVVTWEPPLMRVNESCMWHGNMRPLGDRVLAADRRVYYYNSTWLGARRGVCTTPDSQHT